MFSCVLGVLPRPVVDRPLEGLQLAGDNRVQRGHRRRASGGTADGTKFEAVVGERKRGGSISVGLIFFDRGDFGQFQIDHILFDVLARRQPLRLEPGQDRFERRADENGDNGGRRLVGAQPVIVTLTGDAGPQQVVVVVDRLDHIDKESQEGKVRAGVVPGDKQVLAVAGRQGPIVVLSVPIQPGKRLFIK